MLGPYLYFAHKTSTEILRGN